jgi:hypothetical protein
MRIIKGVVAMHGHGQCRPTKFRVAWMGRQGPGLLAAGPSRGTRALNNLRTRHLNLSVNVLGRLSRGLSYMLHMDLLVQLGGRLELGSVPKVGNKTNGYTPDLQSRVEERGHVRHRHSSVAARSQYTAREYVTAYLPLHLLYLRWHAWQQRSRLGSQRGRSHVQLHLGLRMGRHLSCSQ